MLPKARENLSLLEIEQVQSSVVVVVRFEFVVGSTEDEDVGISAELQDDRLVRQLELL